MHMAKNFYNESNDEVKSQATSSKPCIVSLMKNSSKPSTGPHKNRVCLDVHVCVLGNV